MPRKDHWNKVREGEGERVWELCDMVKGECSVFLKKIILWMKTIHYPNTLRSHLVTIVPMALFLQNQLQS